MGFGLLMTLLVAIVGTASLMQTLSTVTPQELKTTIWAPGKPLFLLWAILIPVGMVLGVIGALIYAEIKKRYLVLVGVGYLFVVIPMMIVFTRFYYGLLFGIGGSIILITFCAIVWIWMKNYRSISMQGKLGSVFQLIGYLFFITASWFLCGEFAPLRLKAFEGRNPPSPIEIIVYLALGWLFIFLSHYQSNRSKLKNL